MMRSLEEPVLLNVADLKLRVTPEEFARLCQLNRDLRLELTKDGELIVMPPTGGETGKRNINIAADVVIWNRQTGLGEAFDSSTGYDFSAFGGKNPSPDVSWIEKSRLEGIDISGFIPVVPDFVIELRSKSDPLKDVRAKMEEYRRVGVRLGWLINPQQQPLGATHAEEASARLHPQVEIYRLEQDVEVLEAPVSLSGEDVLPGFTLDLRSIF
jgi:Uma2 family endonuclease